MRNHCLFGLQAMRERRDIAVQTLADALGCTRNSYYRYENGERRITFDRVCLIADILDCTTDELRGPRLPDTVINLSDTATTALEAPWSAATRSPEQ